MQIGIDPNKSHNGARSLRLMFQVRTNLDAVNVSQLVPVQPQTEYEFECYVSTDKLETGSAPQIQIRRSGRRTDARFFAAGAERHERLESHQSHFQDRRKD